MKNQSPLNETEREELIHLREENQPFKDEGDLRKKVISLASRKRNRSKEKTEVILSLFEEFKESKVSECLKLSKLPKSSFYEWKKKLIIAFDKNKELKE